MWLKFDNKLVNTNTVIKIFCNEISIHVKYLNGTQEIVKTYGDEEAMKSAFTKICYTLERDNMQKWLMVEYKLININTIINIFCDEIFIYAKFVDDTQEIIKSCGDEKTTKSEFIIFSEFFENQNP